MDGGARYPETIEFFFELDIKRSNSNHFGNIFILVDEKTKRRKRTTKREDLKQYLDLKQVFIRWFMIQ